MFRHALSTAAVAAAALAGPAAQATTYPVMFNVLNESATLASTLVAGDVLRLDTLVTNETGALTQSITFNLGAGVGNFGGRAVWEVSPATETGPRLVGVNIDLLDSTNTVVASDTFAGVLAGFAHSTFAGAIGPGTYTLRATGTGVRESSLDVTLTFAAAVPEPETYALMLAGIGVVGLLAVRRRR